MNATALITGNSSGLGRGLSQVLLDRNWQVYGLSRRGAGITHAALHDQRCDLADFGAIEPALQTLLNGVDKLDLVILNAGLLGEIRDLAQTPLAEIRQVMDVNVWANKIIIDWLIANGLAPAQMVLISSGASVNGHRGWGAYALSKASLNMLTQLYAAEMPDSHLCALAPGLIDTAMQDYLCDPGQVDSGRYASVEKLRAARGTESMPTPTQAAMILLEALPRLREHPSGCFLDLRTLD